MTGRPACACICAGLWAALGAALSAPRPAKGKDAEDDPGGKAKAAGGGGKAGRTVALLRARPPLLLLLLAIAGTEALYMGCFYASLTLVSKVYVVAIKKGGNLLVSSVGGWVLWGEPHAGEPRAPPSPAPPTTPCQAPAPVHTAWRGSGSRAHCVAWVRLTRTRVAWVRLTRTLRGVGPAHAHPRGVGQAEWAPLSGSWRAWRSCRSDTERLRWGPRGLELGPVCRRDVSPGYSARRRVWRDVVSRHERRRPMSWCRSLMVVVE